MTQTHTRDMFPVYMILALAACVTSTVALLHTGHPLGAAVAAATFVIAALTFGGWLVAGPYLEADLVVTIRARGGKIPKSHFATPDSSVEERLLRRLELKGVISVDDNTISLHEDKIGRVLAFFIRLRLA